MFNLSSELVESLIALRQDIHRHPELSGEEHETAQRLASYLAAHGITASPILGTGLLVDLESGDKRPGEGVVLLRADIDALPIEEQTDLPHRSIHPGVMHACGHDAHAAMLAAALVVLKQKEGLWSGRVRAIFQPAEEVGTHTHELKEQGIMDEVQAVFGMHVMPLLPRGTVGVTAGPVMAGAENFTIKLSGEGGHGGNPHLGVDGVVAGSALVQALQTIVAREINPLDAAVLTIGSFHAGTRPNILASEVTLEGNTRFFASEVGDQLMDKMRRISTQVASTYRMEVELASMSRVPPVINSDRLVLQYQHALASWRSESPTALVEPVPLPPLTVSEDFARYLEHAPGMMVFLGTAEAGNEQSAKPLHDAAFYPPESILAEGVKLHLAAVLSFAEQGSAE